MNKDQHYFLSLICWWHTAVHFPLLWWSYFCKELAYCISDIKCSMFHIVFMAKYWQDWDTSSWSQKSVTWDHFSHDVIIFKAQWTWHLGNLLDVALHFDDHMNDISKSILITLRAYQNSKRHFSIYISNGLWEAGLWIHISDLLTGNNPVSSLRSSGVGVSAVPWIRSRAGEGAFSYFGKKRLLIWDRPQLCLLLKTNSKSMVAYCICNQSLWV